MRCSECKYYNEKISTCEITHIHGTQYCGFEDIEKCRICFNCKHWIGGGDFGLSCDIKYELATANGFKVACDKFDRKNRNGNEDT